MSGGPFERDTQVDKPGIVGARWWHDALVDEDRKMARRTAIKTILGASAAAAVVAGGVWGLVKAVNGGGLPDDVQERRDAALQLQRDYGWDFGYVGEPLVFDGRAEQAFDPSALASLADDLTPRQTGYRPYYQPTLFQSPFAMPTAQDKLPPEDVAGWKPLKDALRPAVSPAMEASYARGRSLASLFVTVNDAGELVTRTSEAKVALIVDLPGPHAVAFAAGLAGVFDPVFLFDNWPHPRGVVRAHDTLAAAAYYQPLFRKEAAVRRPSMLPAFVLDRHRLAPYGDDVQQFDNRYVAKLPSAAQLRGLGVERVLYVVPTRADLVELDDLNDDFVRFAAQGLPVKMLSLDLFGAEAMTADAGTSPADVMVREAGSVWYGGSAAAHHSFFVDYPWATPARRATLRVTPNPGASYVPSPRVTAFSSGTPSAGAPSPRPAHFGTVPVVVALATGTLLGARYARGGPWNSRSGSWNRASGGWGG